jgi:hypothetical protein
MLDLPPRNYLLIVAEVGRNQSESARQVLLQCLHQFVRQMAR